MGERWTVRFNPKTGEKYFIDEKGNTSTVKPKGYEEPEKIPNTRATFFSVGKKEYQLQPAATKEDKAKNRRSQQPPPKGGLQTSRNNLGVFEAEVVDSEKDLRKKKDKKAKKNKNEETDISAVWDNLKGDSSGVNVLDPETGKLKKKRKQKKKKDDKEMVIEYPPDEEEVYQEIRTSKYAAGAPPRAASSAVLNTVKKPEKPDYLMAANFVPKLTALDAVPHDPTVWDGDYLKYRDWTFWDMFVHEKKKQYKGSTFFKWTLFAHNVGFIASLCLMFFGTVAVFWDFRLDTGILPPGTEDLMVVNGFVGFYSLGVGVVLFVFEKLYGLNKTLFIDGSCGYIRGLFYIGLSIPTFSSYATIMTGLLCILAGVLNFIATYSKEKGKARGPRTYLFEFFEWEAERGTYMVAMLFIFLNVLVFTFNYVKFEFIRLRCIRDKGDASVDLCPSSFAAIAKGFGNNLNFDCALIILPVSRNVLTIVTEKVNKSNSFPIRKAVEFHQIVAAVVAIATIGHTVAHYINYTFVADATIKGFGFFAWYTGAAICLVMGVLFGAAHSVVRKANYELFWYTHHTYSLFFLLLLAHGPFFYQWFFIPILVFAYEKISRHRARLRRKVLVRSVEYIQPVLNINFSFAENFEFREGQYVYLLVPQVNSWQWHPFSISSSNGDLEKFGYMSLHIRVQDDELSWTYGLKEYFKLIAGAGDKPKDAAFFSDNFHYYDSTGKFQKGLHAGPDGRPLIRIDGAYNSPTQVYNSYRDVILVGSGIGLTPSAGILRAILRYKWAKGFFPDTVRFAWVLRQSEVLSFTWFIEMLVDLMARVKSDREGNNLTGNHFIQVNIYVTGTKVDKKEVEETKKDKKKKKKKDKEEYKQPDVNELRTTVKKMFQLAGRRSFIGVERLESSRGPKERLGERRLLEDDLDVFNSGIMKGSKDVLGFDSQNIFEQILSPRVSSDQQKNVLPTSMTAENRMGDIFIWNGRPDWDAVFWQARDSALGRNEKVGLIKQRLREGADYGQIKEEFDYDVDQEGLSLTSDIGVCFCGSSNIGHDLAVATKKYSTRRLEFHLNQEFF